MATPYTPPFGQYLHNFTILSGDKDIFSFVNHKGNHQQDRTDDHSDALDITITPTRAGRFLARVTLFEDNGQSDMGMIVLVNPPPKG
jgi:hypothetical protein